MRYDLPMRHRTVRRTRPVRLASRLTQLCPAPSDWSDPFDQFDPSDPSDTPAAAVCLFGRGFILYHYQDIILSYKK